MPPSRPRPRRGTPSTRSKRPADQDGHLPSSARGGPHRPARGGRRETTMSRNDTPASRRRRSLTIRPLGLAVLVVWAVASCAAGTTGASNGTAGVSAPAAAGSPSAHASATLEPVSSPTAYQAWLDRQGFGGSSGLHQISNEANWLNENAATVRPFDLQEGRDFSTRLIDWLQHHPAIPCWAAYHTQMLALLDHVQSGYGAAQAALAGGQSIPPDVITAIVTNAKAAFELPAPAGCK